MNPIVRADDAEPLRPGAVSASLLKKSPYQKILEVLIVLNSLKGTLNVETVQLKVREFSQGDESLRLPTLYSYLQKLELAGFVKPTRVANGVGRPENDYRITERGYAAWQHWLERRSPSIERAIQAPAPFEAGAPLKRAASGGT